MPNSFKIVAICSQPCQNNGVCTAPEKCLCPSKYGGDYCEFEPPPTLCPDAETITKNVKLVNCKEDECTVNCKDGFDLPDGSIKMSITCVQGQWKPKYSTQNFEPICKSKNKI